jgi:hypothetical protein
MITISKSSNPGVHRLLAACDLANHNMQPQDEYPVCNTYIPYLRDIDPVIMALTYGQLTTMVAGGADADALTADDFTLGMAYAMLGDYFNGETD